MAGSLPSRGAWIEIAKPKAASRWTSSRSPHGERGLKYAAKVDLNRSDAESLPSRGAWIEIT